MALTRRGGVVIGRFMPPHTGHAYLIRFARAYTQHVTVFVCTLAHEPIPGDLRFGWMARLFPEVSLVHVTEEIPQASRSQAGASAIWADAIRSRLETDPRYVFASEEYGDELAAALGADFVPVDPQREVFPVSGRMIREDPFANWRFIPEPVRPYFAKKIVVIDSSGALVPELARSYDTVYATDYPAYARSLALGNTPERSVHELARAQAASEAALLESANRVLFSPTDVARIVSASSLAQSASRELVGTLTAECPSLAPSLIVAAEPVTPAYRAAIAELGWELVETGSVDEARSHIGIALASSGINR